MSASPLTRAAPSVAVPPVAARPATALPVAAPSVTAPSVTAPSVTDQPDVAPPLAASPGAAPSATALPVAARPFATLAMTTLTTAALTCAALMLPGVTLAQTVTPCGDRAPVWAVPEPFEDNTATYAEGAVRLVVLDMIEPALAPVHIVVLHPPYGPVGDRQCHLVSDEGGTGFWDVDFVARQSGYDPVHGLHVTLPAQRPDPTAGTGAPPRALTITVNQSTGAVTARLAP